MPYYNLGTCSRIADTRLGFRVDRANTTLLPQTTNETLFTIAGGRVLMAAIIGECVTSPSGADNAKLTCYPTVATAGDTDICAALDINTCDTGDILSITGTITDAMLVAHKGAAQIGHPIILPIGTLNLDCDANRTGGFKWSLFYVPLDDGAYVEASTISTSTSQYYDEASRQRIRDIVLGCRVDKAATALPAGVYGALFNIAGGKVAITAMIGECTVAVGGANLIKYTATPTTATLVDLSAGGAGADMNTDDIGDLMSFTGIPANDTLGVHNGSINIGIPVAVAIGSVGITCSQNTAGTFKWSLFYVPIDVGAIVAAA